MSGMMCDHPILTIYEKIVKDIYSGKGDKKAIIKWSWFKGKTQAI